MTKDDKAIKSLERDRWQDKQVDCRNAIRMIVQKTVPGGHIGMFMGASTLKEHWPPIARWIAAQ